MPVFLTSDPLTCAEAVFCPGKSPGSCVSPSMGFGSATPYWVTSGMFFSLLEPQFPFWLQRIALPKVLRISKDQMKVRKPFSHCVEFLQK